MADYFGNLLIEQQTLEHQATFFKLAVEQIRRAEQQHGIQETIVVVERTGNYHLPVKRAFAKAASRCCLIRANNWAGVLSKLESSADDFSAS